MHERAAVALWDVLWTLMLLIAPFKSYSIHTFCLVMWCGLMQRYFVLCWSRVRLIKNDEGMWVELNWLGYKNCLVERHLEWLKIVWRINLFFKYGVRTDSSDVIICHENMTCVLWELNVYFIKMNIRKKYVYCITLCLRLVAVDKNTPKKCSRVES